MSRSLCIAMFVGSFPVLSETFILRQITGLLDRGHEVHIYADTRAETDAPVHPEVAGYRLLERTTFMDLPPETAPWEMPVWPITGRSWPPGSKTSVHNSARVTRALSKLLTCLVKALAALCPQPKPYDVLHAHFGPVANSFRFAKELWRAPMVVSFHGYDFSTRPRKEGRDMYRKLFETVDAVTVNSDYTRQQVEKLGCPVAKLHKLPVGLDLDEFPFRERTRPAGESIRILTLARLTEIKGHEYALRAVAKLRERHPAVRHDIVGDGPLRKKLEQLIGQLGLQESVTLHGARAGAELKRIMAEAHIFVLASVNVEGDGEGQGLVLQEAQAVGLPVVATIHGALPEGVLPGRSGFLVPERDVDALAERLNYLVEHPEMWPGMGRDGRRFVEGHYDIRKLNSVLEGLYFRTIDTFAGHRKTFQRRR